MAAPEELIGHRAPWSLNLVHLVEATRRRFSSTRAPIEQIWSSSALHAGDHELAIFQASADDGTLLDRTSAFCQRVALRQGVSPPPVWDRGTLEAVGWLEPELDPARGFYRRARFDDDLSDWTGASIGRALWDLGGFRSLCWDWIRLLDPDDAGRDEPSEGRVHAEVNWDDGVAEVEALRASVFARLRELPRPPEGISRRRFEAVVTADLDQLRALCGKAGIVAQGLLDAPYEKVQRSRTLRSDGNGTLAWVETATQWFGVWMVTS